MHKYFQENIFFSIIKNVDHIAYAGMPKCLSITNKLEEQGFVKDGKPWKDAGNKLINATILLCSIEYISSDVSVTTRNQVFGVFPCIDQKMGLRAYIS